MAETLPLITIRMDGNTQARETLDMVVISEYAEAMKRGDAFPPVDLYFDGTNYWLADGFHRVKAATQVGQDAIAAVVHQGGQREALLHAVGANDTHGLRRSNADKRKAVLTLLTDKEWQEWSDNEVARRTRTSNHFVTKIRQEHLGTFQDSAAPRKVNRGGTTYTMDTGRIGATRTSAPKKAAPAAPTSKSAVVEPQRVQLTAVRSTSPPPGERTTPPVPSPAVPLVVVPRPAVEREEPVAMPPVPALVRAWEQASEEERQVFVMQYRTVLQELLAVMKEEEPAVLPPDVHPDTQPGLILIVLRTATAPLSQEELAQVPGINRRVLGRDLTRLCKTGRIEKAADGRYALVRATHEV